MTWIILLLLIVALIVLRQSLVLVLAVATAYVHMFIAKSKIEFLIQDFWFTVDREVLLSIPLFMLAGNIMSRGSIANRLIGFMQAFTASLPGGLGIACVLSCAAFAAINGSSIVTMLAIGSIMYPALISQGYSKSYALGSIASAGTLGIIIPPSIPLILYGIMTERDISKLFVAGIGPGLLLTLMFVIYAVVTNWNTVRTPFKLVTAMKSFQSGGFALALPFIMIGGIYTGKFSPTESAAVSLAYDVTDTIHLYGKSRALMEVILETTKLLATLLPLLCIAGSLNTILDHSGIPKQMVTALTSSIQDRWVLMLGINVLLLIVGCLMDVGSAILILAPLLEPLAVAKGFDPLHFGIIMIANLEIGYLTPPVGLNLIVAMAAFKESFGTFCKAVIPFIVILLVWLVIVVVYPPLSLFLIGK